jgi:hypothetical protein
VVDTFVPSSTNVLIAIPVHNQIFIVGTMVKYEARSDLRTSRRKIVMCSDVVV